jgi:hypothetical protein
MMDAVNSNKELYNFLLDAHVPVDHVLSAIDRFVDLSELRRDFAPFYSSIVQSTSAPTDPLQCPSVGT